MTKELKEITEEELHEVIKLHYLWLKDDDKGECADLSYTNLIYSELKLVNLSHANFEGANLTEVKMNHSIFIGANFSGANFNDTHTSYANFSGANFNDTVIFDGYKLIKIETE